ncbi:MAG: phage major tail tube protein [Roseburia inulinivorans]|jgi:P2 family phage contractile tail tube protein|nr:MAG: hypothetical protein BHV88_09365 [Clostridiales bacterium 41_12_two_minus]DAM48298.1 MAG TPA: tail tube protein [Caudoviricetes sp.]
MGKRLIPDKIENFNVYLGTAADSNRLIGITDEITLPKLENMSETINLAGMAGEYDSPTVGQYKSMEIEIPFSNISKETLEIAARDNEPMIMRSSQEFIDPETHKKDRSNRTITVKGMTKAVNYGRLKKGSFGNPSITKEVTYYKDEIAGEVVTEIDKFNGKAVIGGVDMTKDILDYI